MRRAAAEANTVGYLQIKTKNLDIEVLRAFAVVITMFSHAGYMLFWGSPALNWLGANFGLWSGVDLFFAISGFVISRRLNDQLSASTTLEERSRVLCAFWIRRAHRILPTAFLWLGIGLILTIIFNRTGAFGDLQGNLVDAASAVVQFADLHYYQCLGPGPDTCGVTRLFGPYWSLSLEEKFYLILPLAMILLRARFKTFVIVAIIVQFVWPRKTHDLFWWLRTDAFLLGVLIALVAGNQFHAMFEPTFIRKNIVTKCVPWILVVLVVGVVTPHQIVPIYTGLLAIVCASLIWIASYNRGYIVGSGIVRSILAWIGSRSYAFYLIHTPVYHFNHELWVRIVGPSVVIDSTFAPRVVLTAVFMITVAAELNFRFIETPFRKRGAAISKKILQPRFTAEAP